MRTEVKTSAKAMTTRRKWHNRWMKTVFSLAAVTVFCTTYALILPAITASTDTFCGHEEHTHEAECYTLQLVCGLEEGESQEATTNEVVTVETEEVLVDEGHAHTDACYQTETVLVCDIDEVEAKEAVIDEETGEVIEEAVEGHTHSDACYEETTTLVCNEEEREAVYEVVEKEVVTEEKTAAVEGHKHTDACYEEVLSCGKEEHEHSEACFVDKTADTEKASDWEKTLPKKSAFTGEWREDTLTVAKSQLGYRESSVNFINQDGERKGYTRYGAMYGIPYGDWCGMFVQFSMHYAGVPTKVMAGSPSVPTWVKDAKEAEQFQAAGEYTPQAGDIIFFDWDHKDSADHVGIVEEVKKNNDGEVVSIITIEGNSKNEVRRNTYKANDSDIYGYAVIPDTNPEEALDELEEIALPTTNNEAEVALGNQTLVATFYTDDTYTEVANETTAIVLSGEMPVVRYTDSATGEEKVEPAVEVKAYKVDAPQIDETEAVFAYDITIFYIEGYAPEGSDGTFQPVTPLQVSFESALLQDETVDSYSVYHINEDGGTEFCGGDNSNKDNGVVAFDAHHFSPYMVHVTPKGGYLPETYGAYPNEEGEPVSADIELTTTTESGIEVSLAAPQVTLPAGTNVEELKLNAEEIQAGTVNHVKYEVAAVAEIVNDEYTEVKDTHFFNISVVDANNNEISIQDASANVSVVFPEKEVPTETTAVDVLQFDAGQINVLESEATIAEETLEAVSFTAENPNVIGVIETKVITERFISASGAIYDVTVTYDVDAEIPNGSTLKVTEYDVDSEEYKKIESLHQSANKDEDIEAVIESEVDRIMAEQEQTMQDMIANGDAVESEFTVATREEVRQAVEETVMAERQETLSLLDISILDADGNEVEPKAPVQVEIVMEQLPEDTTGCIIKNTLHVQHYKETENGLEPETVALANEGIGEIWVDGDDVTTVTFNTDSFSFYTLAWNEHNDQLDLDVMRTTVYYGFVIEGKFREFPGMRWVTSQHAEENTTGNGNLIDGNHVYELDKEGWVSGMSNYSEYTFSKAVVKRDGFNGGSGVVTSEPWDEIAIDPTYGGPVIVGNETDGYVVTLKNGGTYRLGNADIIYVIYDSPYGDGVDYNYAQNSTPENPVLGGDTYGLDESGHVEPLGEPEHRKTLSENQSDGRNDNTYRLSLTAAGKLNRTEENTKADIILITDYSGSMQGNGVRKLNNAVNNGLLPALRQLEDEFGYGTIEISHIPFRTTAEVRNANIPVSDYTFDSWGSGATNYEDAFAKLGQIKTRSDAKTYVIFITDGNPTVRNSKGEINQWDGESDIYAHGYTSDEYFWTYRNNKWQWVRIGDIEKDHNYNWYNNMYLYGSGNEVKGLMRDCYNVTIPYVQQLVKNNVDFNVIATLPGATYASSMVDVGNAARENSSHYYYADNTDAIKAAFDMIINGMESELSYKFVSIDDEMAAVAETVLVDTPGDFEYFRYPSHVQFVNNMTDKTPDTHSDALAVDQDGNALDEDGNKCSESGKAQAKRLDFRWAEAPAASFVKEDGANGKVSWPLNTVDAKDETYEVTFTVYPNQKGWDAIADVMNNPSHKDLYEGQLLFDGDGNFIGVYANEEAKLQYKEVETVVVDGDETKIESELKTAIYSKPIMKVDPTTMKVRKVWLDNYDISNWEDKTVNFDIIMKDKNDQVFTTTSLSKANDKGMAKVKFDNDGNVIVVAVSNESGGWTILKDSNGNALATNEELATLESFHYWENEVYIAPGLIATDVMRPNGVDPTTPLPGATGHRYYAREQGDDPDYELKTQEFTPYKYNGEMQYGQVAALNATNVRKGQLKVEKIVKNGLGEVITPQDQVFTITGKITDANGGGYNTAGNQVTYSIFNAGGVVYDHRDGHNDVESSLGDGRRRTAGICNTNSGKTDSVSIKLRAGEYVVFYNLPYGTKWEMEETDANIPAGYSRTGYVVNGGDLTTDKMSEQTIDAEQDSVTVYNTKNNPSVKFTKVDMTDISKTLDGAEFQLLTTKSGQSGKPYINVFGDPNTGNGSQGYGATYNEERYFNALKDGSAGNGTRKLDKYGFVVSTSEPYDRLTNADGQYIRYMPNEVRDANIVFTTGTDGAGVVDLGELPPGTYKLVETKAPDGYNLPSGEITITVSDDGTVSVIGAMGELTQIESDLYGFTVGNNPGKELPETGGIGTTIYTMAGLLLMIVALISLMYRRNLKRKEVRTRG